MIHFRVLEIKLKREEILMEVIRIKRRRIKKRRRRMILNGMICKCQRGKRNQEE
jgi:hypothetical protein